jgi:hypothetical protein
MNAKGRFIARLRAQIVDSGVFWPVQADPLFRLTRIRLRGVGTGRRLPDL